MTSRSAVNITLCYCILFLLFNSIYGSAYEICEEKICIQKCCPEGQMVTKLSKICSRTTKSLDFSDLAVFDADVTKVMSSAKNMHLVPGMFNNETLRRSAIALHMLTPMKGYLTEAGVIYMESPNAYQRWTRRDFSKFCVEYYKRSGHEPIPRIWVQIDDLTDRPGSPTVLSPYAKLIGDVFLLLILFIYPLVPANRTINGVMHLLFVLSLFNVFVLVYVISSQTNAVETCLKYTYSIYFMYLSAFSWMSVIAFNIWRTFRNHIKSRPDCNVNRYIIYILYCLYAWGVPLAMTGFFYAMNTSNLENKPWIITPQVPRHGCFIEGFEKVLYMYVPSLIFLLICVVFYVVTARYMIRLRRGKLAPKEGAAVIPAELRVEWQRYKVNIVLLFAVLFHCVLDMGSSMSRSTGLPYIADVYGIFFGPLLFIILVVYSWMLHRTGVRRQEKPAMSQPLNLQDKTQSTPSKIEMTTISLPKYQDNKV